MFVTRIAMLSFCAFTAFPQHPSAPAQTVGSETGNWSGALADATRTDCGVEVEHAVKPGSCPRLAIGTTRFCAAQHVFRGEGGPRRQAGPAARGQISPQATDIDRKSVVKAGRGGKRARRRVDRYLRKLQI